MPQPSITYDRKARTYSDATGNRASVEFFGSHAKALRTLRSLLDCRNCRDRYARTQAVGKDNPR